MDWTSTKFNLVLGMGGRGISLDKMSVSIMCQTWDQNSYKPLENNPNPDRGAEPDPEPGSGGLM